MSAIRSYRRYKARSGFIDGTGRNNMSLTGDNQWTGAKGILAILAGAAVLAACFALLYGALRGEDEETAKADFCDSLNEFSATVDEYQHLDPLTATNDEVEQASDDLESAWDDVLDQGNDWVNAYDNELTDAYWDLYYAVQDLPGENTVSDNLDELQPELSAFPTAFQQTFDGAGCSAA
jgi:hypothetical protein